MDHNYGVISGSHPRRDCVWPIIWMQSSIQPALESECYRNHQVQCNIPTFQVLLLLRKYVPISQNVQKV